MKAAVHSTYGSPDVLSIRETPKPVQHNDEVLVRVHATTVNRTDLGMLRGTPFIIRFFTGLTRPRLAITGCDFAGMVETVGKDVKSFRAGDRVMGFGGMGIASHAEYLTIPESKAILTIPELQDYEQAVACLEGPFYALRCVEATKPITGQKALVNGTTGAIGSAVVQFLKYYGLYVTAVCGTAHKELVRSLGADKIIDYQKEDFTKDNEQYDLVIDAVGKSSFGKCKHLLKAKGIYTSTDGFENLFLSLVTPLLGGKSVIFRPPVRVKEGLMFIRELVEQGKFRPLIDRRYPFAKIVEAFNYVATGEKVGSVILEVVSDQAGAGK